MNEPINELREQRTKVVEDLMYAKPEQYWDRMTPVIAQLKTTLAGIHGAPKNLRPTVERLLKVYIPHEQDPKDVAKIIHDMRSICHSVLEVLDVTAPIIDGMITRFSSVTPQYFRWASVATMIAIDSRDAAPLFDAHKGLDTTASELEKLEKLLKATVKNALERQAAGAGEKVTIKGRGVKLPEDAEQRTISSHW